MKIEFIEFWNFFSFANLFYLIPSALNLALKMMIRHDELENMIHGVLRDALVEVSGTQKIGL